MHLQTPLTALLQSGTLGYTNIGSKFLVEMENYIDAVINMLSNGLQYKGV